MLQALILGIVQGLTEFIPVSSTAHLVVLPWFLGWDGELLNSLRFDVAVHAGTLLSILFCFHRDLRGMILEKKKRPLIKMIIIGSIPAAAFGLLMHDYVEGALRSPYVIVFTLVAFGGVLYVADAYGRRKRKLGSMAYSDALFIGAAQVLALVPGVSRSGITMSAALKAGFRREEAARFSFLLSIPVIAGAVVLEVPKFFSASVADTAEGAAVAVGFLGAFLTGVLAIRFMLGFLQRRGFGAFVVYRFVLAGGIAGWLWLAG